MKLEEFQSFHVSNSKNINIGKIFEVGQVSANTFQFLLIQIPDANTKNIADTC